MERAVTLLPQPLSPTRQTVSPAFRVSETSSTARRGMSPERKSSLRFLISSNGIGVWRVNPKLQSSNIREIPKPELQDQPLPTETQETVCSRAGLRRGVA